MAGWRLHGYVVEQLLGRGASSEVWRARIAATGDAVALKRLFLTDAEQIKRARSEAALLTVLDHPNLVRLHDLVPTPDAAVLVLDLADGGSLADLLAARGRLTPGEVITAVAPVAAALAYVHRQGVVHGDVSPANLLFTPGGVALLADLGVARLTDDESDAESTPAYMDPAVAAGCVPAAASDVFMLGAVALHALTGAPLWSAGPGASPDDVVAVARRADVSAVEPRLVAAGVPDEMATVVLRALTVEPTLRCSAADFALDLRHSGCPVAVELAAGRPRPEPAPSDHASTAPPLRTPQFGETTPKASGRPYGPRHAAPIGGDATPAGRARERVRPAATVAPPDAAGQVAGAPAPTNAVRRPRPVIPRRPAATHHAAPRRGRRGRRRGHRARRCGRRAAGGGRAGRESAPATRRRSHRLGGRAADDRRRPCGGVRGTRPGVAGAGVRGRHVAHRRCHPGAAARAGRLLTRRCGDPIHVRTDRADAAPGRRDRAGQHPGVGAAVPRPARPPRGCGAGDRCAHRVVDDAGRAADRGPADGLI